jgi:hypothetical protein
MYSLVKSRIAAANAIAIVVIGVSSGCVSPPAPSMSPSVAPPIARLMPPTDCTAWVGKDRNVELPGYRLPQQYGATACVPLLLTANKPPPGYAGDYYVAEFTDAKLKERWAA